MPEEPEEAGAELELLPDELLPDDEDELLLDARGCSLVPTVITLATAGAIGVRATSFLADCAPLTVVTW